MSEALFIKTLKPRLSIKEKSIRLELDSYNIMLNIRNFRILFIYFF